jgi:hypothetical protein
MVPGFFLLIYWVTDIFKYNLCIYYISDIRYTFEAGFARDSYNPASVQNRR